MQSGDAGGEQRTQPPEDVQLFRLKEDARTGTHSAQRTPFTVASGLLVACGGCLLIAGAALPWLRIGDVTVAAVREGGPDGAAATFAMAAGAADVIIGVIAALGRRRLPRFVHWLSWLLGAATFLVVRYRSDILGNLVFVHNADVRGEGTAVVGPGIAVVYAGIALSVAAPLLSLRQALRVLRT